MVRTKRSHHNPVILPNKAHNWEAEAAFNGSIVAENGIYHMLYRALSVDQLYAGTRLHLSTIGYAYSGDGVHFKRRRQFLVPEYDWEKYGVEDPRITKIDDTYYIFYTAISNWPPNAAGIKIAVAVSKDLQTIQEKHPVTPFNAKAMVLFPEKIGDKYYALLTIHTDMPPSKICIAKFDRMEQVWDPSYWKEWYAHVDDHVLAIQKTDRDQIEVGAVPVKSADGWIVVIGFIQNYFSDNKIFRIDSVLLDASDPQKIIGQTMDPMLVPEEEYELYGQVPNVVFPSGAMIEEGQFYFYYGACP
jgi:beta-1,2-mannobiose phosphorylase / 1,2-beta-oligomannan phosphorylase